MLSFSNPYHPQDTKHIQTKSGNFLIENNCVFAAIKIDEWRLFAAETPQTEHSALDTRPAHYII